MYYQIIDTTNVDFAREISHNFTVEGQRLKTENGVTLIPDKKAMIRTDTNQYLGTVGINWEPVQPEVLYNMAENLLEATNGRINGILNMFDGAVIGISFKLAEREYVENDKIDLNFVMLTAFNGVYGLSGNALAYRHQSDSLANTSNRVFNLRHTKFVANRIEVVKDMLKYYNQEITSFDAIMNRLVTRPMSNAVAIDWFQSLFPTPKSDRSTLLLENSTAEFVRLLRRQRQQGVQGTSYGAWCALIEYINHSRTVRVHNDRDPEEVRFQSINFGSGNRIIQKAMNKLTDFHFTEEEFIID